MKPCPCCTAENHHRRSKCGVCGQSLKAKTPAERVRASQAKKIAAGGRRMPDGILPPDATAALEALRGAGYAASANGVIARALEEAAGMRPRQRKFTRLRHP